MRFWDSSALVPLLVEEPTSSLLHSALHAVPDVAAWWGTPVECTSALTRREADGSLTSAQAQEAARFLDDLRGSWKEISPSDQLRSIALRLVRTHELRAGDALQLAAAIVASEHRPETLELVTLDDRLALAASREGFRVLPAA